MPAGRTYTPIATNTLGSAAASVTFSSISGSYTDLILVADTVNATGADNFLLNFNSDTGSNYSVTRLNGNGSAAASSRATNQTVLQCGEVYSTRSTTIVQILNYSNTTTYKTTITRQNTAANTVAANVNLWRSTAAITTILISTSSYNFSAGSTFTLYGIAAA
jgi:predicted DNA binding protein